jgi:predicted DNA-binding transcriptional regulator YafY
VRADRLVSLVLLLQARGRATARVIAAELQVSVRTVYRDLEALAAAGVPVLAEPGPGGGCRLMEGYRFPLRGLRPDEAEALLILGVPGAVRELGLDRALDAAQRQIRATALGGAQADGTALVHLDLPRWFGGQEEVPCLRDLARALRSRRRLALGYRPRDARAGQPEQAQPEQAQPEQAQPEQAQPQQAQPEQPEPRVVAPLGLVNKAGIWYLVAAPEGSPSVRVFRAARIASVRVLAEPFDRPAGFDLAGFWRQWSAEFEASRPRLQVALRASPAALAAFGEVFGQAAGPALEAALPADEHGWRVVTLSFEHERAAAHRLAGFGDQVEVLTPHAVRAGLVATARQIVRRYHADDG